MHLFASYFPFPYTTIGSINIMWRNLRPKFAKDELLHKYSSSRIIIFSSILARFSTLILHFGSIFHVNSPFAITLPVSIFFYFVNIIALFNLRIWSYDEVVTRNISTTSKLLIYFSVYFHHIISNISISIFSVSMYWDRNWRLKFFKYGGYNNVS